MAWHYTNINNIPQNTREAYLCNELSLFEERAVVDEEVNDGGLGGVVLEENVCLTNNILTTRLQLTPKI